MALTSTSKLLIAVLALGTAGAAFYTWQTKFADGPAAQAPDAGKPATPGTALAPGKRPLVVVINQWPGLMPLVVGLGGLTTQPGSIAAGLGLDVKIEFIEDPPTRNKALIEGKADAIWHTVDELPITLPGLKAAGIDARAFFQVDWSRGGDACVASREVKTVEQLVGRKAATLQFSPDHTLFEFMVTNSRLSFDQIEKVRKNTALSPDDPTAARTAFTQGKVDVACLWEPDVTLALESRRGAHRLFSTSDASELIADIFVARKELLDQQPEVMTNLVRMFLAAVKKTEEDRASAARLVSTVCSRFRDELGYEKTVKSFDWVKLADLSDNVRLFGLDGQPPGFDRVYTEAESIWLQYPQAEIKDRFAPASIRDDRIINRIWTEEGRIVSARREKFSPQIAATGTPIFTKPVTIRFASARFDLSTEARAVVNRRVLPQLQIARGMYIRVEGNTDAIGNPKKNLELSEKRAEAVVEYLISRGVDPGRIVAKGNGPGKPIASNKSPEGRAKNRRTDVLFIPAPAAS